MVSNYAANCGYNDCLVGSINYFDTIIVLIWIHQNKQFLILECFFVRNSNVNNGNDNFDYEMLDYMALQGDYKILAAENPTPHHPPTPGISIYIIFPTNIFLFYCLMSNTAVNMPKQTIVKSYICIYSKIGNWVLTVTIKRYLTFLRPKLFVENYEQPKIGFTISHMIV